MKVTVKLFASARDLVGNPSVDVTLPDGATVAELRGALVEHYPQLAPLLRHAVFAVNTEYVASQTVLAPADDVACIPPVSGG